MADDTPIVIKDAPTADQTKATTAHAASESTPSSPPPSSWDLKGWLTDWVFTNFGRRGLLLLSLLSALLLGWWNWDKIETLPGVSNLVSHMKEESLPKPVVGTFNVAVAHFVNDLSHQYEQLIVEELAKFGGGLTILQFDRTIAPAGGNVEQAFQQGHQQARALLKQSGADVFIWGRVVLLEGKSAPSLFWTTNTQAQGAKHHSERYRVADFILPPLFWNDLTDVLGLLVLNAHTEFTAEEGHFVAARLAPFIERVRTLVASNKDRWNRETQARVRHVLAAALVTYGEQAGKKEALAEAIELYREALKERTRERVPLEWAMTQMNLGTALWRLGELEPGTGRLEEAVTANREALKEFTRERVPLDWAKTQMNLGAVLTTLGQREAETGRLEEAVTAYRESLKERTRERVPLQWAMTQMNLGSALSTLGERETDIRLLDEAVKAYDAALVVFREGKADYYVQMASNNRKRALQAIVKVKGLQRTQQ